MLEGEGRKKIFVLVIGVVALEFLDTGVPDPFALVIEGAYPCLKVWWEHHTNWSAHAMFHSQSFVIFSYKSGTALPELLWHF